MDTVEHLEISELPDQSCELIAVAEWLNEEWGQSKGYDLSDTLRWCKDLAKASNETIIVARRDDQLMGCVCVVECDLESRKKLSPWLSSLFVPMGERGGLIGQALVDAACNWARRTGFTNMFLYALEGSLTAYYGRLGWVQLSSFTLDGATFGLMHRPLCVDGEEAEHDHV
ncbi:MAG: GNAT family N-acetyltransferase [Pseudomonadota bacterium]